MKRSAGATDGGTDCVNAVGRSLEAYSVDDLLELEAGLEHRVGRGTATLSDFGDLAQIRREIEGRRRPR